MKNKKTLLRGLDKFLKEKDIKKLQDISTQIHVSQIHDHIRNWKIENILLLLRYLNKEESSKLFTQLNPKKQKICLGEFTKEEIYILFDELYIDEAIDILDELNEETKKLILDSTSPKTTKKIRKILKYNKTQSGYHMTVDYVSVPSNVTIKTARSIIKKQIKNDDLEIVGNIFAVDEEFKLVGYVTPDDMLVATDNKKLSSFIKDVKATTTTDSVDLIKDVLGTYDIPSAPVIDSKGKLVGIVEAEDIIERYEDIEEAMLESSNVKAIKPYMESTAFELFKSRCIWIIILLLFGTFTQIIIVGFQMIWSESGAWVSSSESGVAGSATISMIATLAFSTALSVASSINDAAGNSGAQTTATLVRSLALDEIESKDYSKALKKETKVALLIGLAVAVTAYFRLFLVWGIMGQMNGITLEDFGWMNVIAAIACISFSVSIIVGNFVGAFLPIVSHKYNLDGAVVSGPVQTTIVDIFTFFIYLSLTTAVFVPLVQSGAI